MSLRSTDSLTKQMRDILLDLEELKAAQLVGNSQIIVKEFVSDQISVRSTSSGYTAEAYASCTVTAPDLADGNILITYCVPEIRLNGTLVNNSTATSAYSFALNEFDTGNAKTNGYQASIYHTSLSGETVPAETFTVRFHVWSAALVELSAKGGLYG